MIVAVGSTNFTKIGPVRNIFSKHFQDIEVVGVKVKSGVPEQPMDNNQMYLGALTRAKLALKRVKGADFGVGIEGGLQEHSYGWFESSIVVIVNKKGDIGIGASGGLILPKKIMEKIHSGKNLEQAVDELFGTTKIGEGIGMFGVMTKEVVTRATGVEHGVAFALSRFLHPQLY